MPDIRYPGSDGWKILDADPNSLGASPAPAGCSPSGMRGLAATILVVDALLAGTVASLKRPWTRVVVRVTGSWIAAIGLVMFGWSVRLAGR